MLAAVLLTENSRFSIPEQAVTAILMLAVLGIVLVLLLFATRVDRWIGSAGASVISRVMGLILSAVAATCVLNGVKTYFEL